MTEQFNEQISQFIDDEMSSEESDFFVRRLQNDAQARRQFLRYQLIGAAVRGENSHPVAADLGRRLEQALEHEASALRRQAARWPQLAAGAGIAASVALVAVFGLRFVNLGPDSLLASAGDALAEVDPPSYVVPPSVVEAQQLVRVSAEVTGIQYLIHHARYSSGVSRTIMQSSVIAAQETDPAIEDADADEEAPIE